MNIEEQVLFMGFVSNAAALMTQHRICLDLVNMESFGIVWIELMAIALPMFAPAADGIPQIFDDDV